MSTVREEFMQSFLEIVSCDTSFCEQNGMCCRQQYPGFIGKNYKKGGLVIIGVKPATPNKNIYIKNNEIMQEILDKFMAFETEDIFEEYLEKLSTYMKIWPSITLVSEKTRKELRYHIDDIAFINIAKCFTWEPSPNGNEMEISSQFKLQVYSKCFREHTLHQLRLLAPNYVVFMGNSALKTFIKINGMIPKEWGHYGAQNGQRNNTISQRLLKIRPIFDTFNRELLNEKNF